MWQRQREAASILKCWSRITAKGVSIDNRERWKSTGPARSRESREQGTLRDRCGIDQSMSTPHWNSKCRSPLDDNKFPFNRIYLKFLFLFLAATHTQLHLHLYYSPLLTACLPSLSLSLPSPQLLVALLHDCCGFYSSRVALAPNSFLLFRFYCF